MNEPIYLRGLDRERAEKIASMFMHSYQPPVECAHRASLTIYKVDGVKGRFKECPDCGYVVGVLR